MSAAVNCPICSKPVSSIWINQHIDSGCGGASKDASVLSSSSQSSVSAGKRKAVNGSDGTAGKKSKTSGSAADVKPRPSGSSVAASSTANGASTSSGAPVSSNKRFTTNAALENAKPLAERMRPSSLDEVAGQKQLLGEGALFRSLIDQDRLGSALFWGPPGTGKTTLARVIAHTTKSTFRELSATSASTADLRKVFDEATNTLKLVGKKTLLFIDELQRFTKAQQDLLLPVVESGVISLIASTTENPSFRVNGALLSRCRVFVLSKLSADDIYQVLLRALRTVFADKLHPSPATSSPVASTSTSPPISDAETDETTLFAVTSPIDASLLHFLSSAADGDARVALSSLELAISATKDSKHPLDREELKAQLRKAHLQYDRTGDHHYDTISALHKSVRGGDADAALYWLARMLEGGDDPTYVARRLVRMAAEDIGLARPEALPQAVAAYQATTLLGMPECDVILAQIVVMLAESPKSVRVYKAYGRAKALVREEENYPVPLSIRNAPTGLMKSLGYGAEYKYNPGFLHPVTQPFLPPELLDRPEARFLRDEDSVEDRTYDEAALREWEKKELGGERWEGREDMEKRLREGGRGDELEVTEGNAD